jgi:uncharacterized glyoxalase superfamily protein PhnB
MRKTGDEEEGNISHLNCTLGGHVISMDDAMGTRPRIRPNGTESHGNAAMLLLSSTSKMCVGINIYPDRYKVVV